VWQVAAELARKSCLAMKTVQLLTGKVEGQAAVQREDDQERAELREDNEVLRGRVNALQDQLEAAHKVGLVFQEFHFGDRHQSFLKLLFQVITLSLS
jgi:hypothetical protein